MIAQTVILTNNMAISVIINRNILKLNYLEEISVPQNISTIDIATVITCGTFLFSCL